jgi:SAM-dependent methyltransferase
MIVTDSLSPRAAWQVDWVHKWPAFRTAKTVLELGSGSFETLAHLARSYPDKQFFGVDFQLKETALLAAQSAPRNLHVLQHDVQALGLFEKETFDFAFSIALLEHIRELEMHLSEVHRVLKKGGQYCFMTAPLWSSSLGHHCDHNSPDCPIPHYGHLYMTKEQLGDFLVAKKGLTPEARMKILRRIFERRDLSRLSLSQVKHIVRSSPFKIDTWREGEDKNHTRELAALVMKNNIHGLREDDLRVSSLVCCLVKAGEEGVQSSKLAGRLSRAFVLRFRFFAR